MLRHKCNKGGQDMYPENYKALLREIKELKKCRHLMFMNQKLILRWQYSLGLFRDFVPKSQLTYQKLSI